MSFAHSLLRHLRRHKSLIGSPHQSSARDPYPSTTPCSNIPLLTSPHFARNTLPGHCSSNILPFALQFLFHAPSPLHVCVQHFCRGCPLMRSYSFSLGRTHHRCQAFFWVEYVLSQEVSWVRVRRFFCCSSIWFT